MYETILETKNSSPTNNALLFTGKYVDYQTLITEIDDFANGLHDLGIKSGDTVTMAMPNIFESIYAFYAVNKIGALSHLVHPLTPVNQMERFMAKTGSNTLIIVDTFFNHYKDLIKNPHIKLILANPTRTMGFVKKFGYKLINRAKLKNIKYGNQVLSYSKMLGKEEFHDTSKINAKKTSVYLHSGGTSGEPKTIELSNFAINSLASNTAHILGETNFKNKHMLAVLPLFHGFGLCMGTHAMLCFGGVDTLMPKFDALETIKLLKTNQVNYVIGVPSLFENLIGKHEIRGAHLKNLHQAFVGGDYVALDLKHRFDRLMKEFGSKARLLEGYGLTEVVTVCSVNTLKEHLQTSVGKPLPGLNMEIVSMEDRKFLERGKDGEIVVSGDTMMNGYLENKSHPKDNPFLIDSNKKKWVLTGDFGFIDAEGFVHFKQRLKRIIKVSGMPVLPSEIENLVMNFNEIKEVAAIGVPDQEKGSMIKLYIVVHPNAVAEMLEKRIKEAIRLELSVYALPKEIIYMDELPKTMIGKTDTRKLESMG